MTTVRYMRLLYLSLLFSNTIPLVETQSNTMFAASTLIGTNKQGHLSAIETREAKSEIQCALQCLDEKHCMTIKYGQADSECRLYLYHDAEHLGNQLPQQIFRVIDCPDGWIAFDMSCYQINTVELTWHDAMEACKVVGGYLVEIESAREDDFITGLIPDSVKGVYIGGTDEEIEREWVWASSGNQLIFKNWYPKLPVVDTNYNYLFKAPIWDDGMWKGRTGFYKYLSICEI